MKKEELFKNIELLEKAIKDLEDIYAPSVDTYKLKRELLQQYRREWHELKQAIK